MYCTVNKTPITSSVLPWLIHRTGCGKGQVRYSASVSAAIVQCAETYRKHCSSSCITDKFEIHLKLSHGQGQAQTTSHTSKCFQMQKFAFCLYFGLHVFTFGLVFWFFVCLFVCFWRSKHTCGLLCGGRLLYELGHKSCNITVGFSAWSHLINGT